MIATLIKRFSYAVLLLGVISVMAFYLSKAVPGDEILDYLSIDDPRYSTSADPMQQRDRYAMVAEKRGLNLPLFYFSVTPGYIPDSLYRIVPAEDRQTLRQWARVSHDKEGVMALYHQLRTGLSATCPQVDTVIAAQKICDAIGGMFTMHDLFGVHHAAIRLNQEVAEQHSGDTVWTALCMMINRSVEHLIQTPQSSKTENWIPSFSWHGLENQYHQWISGLILFKPLTSLVDGRNAWTKIGEALKWTLLLNGFAFLLAIAGGMWIGMWSGARDGRSAEKIVSMVLFALFALPSFWLATLMIYMFSSGEWLNLFPAGGLGPYHSANGFTTKALILARHLFLPVMCLTLGSLAYVSRQMKQSVVDQLQQRYVFFLRAQGIREKNILWKHVFRNALFPMITMIGSSLPALLSGSLIIEVIFSIPGMGRLLYTSLLARDWPVVFPVLMLGAAITVLSYFLTDIVYKWADPRVKTLEA